MKRCAICQGSHLELFCTVEDREERGRSWEIWRCQSCGYGWTMPWLEKTEVARYYPASYLGDTHRRMEDFLSGKLKGSRSWQMELDKVKLVESFASAGKILDVGCAHCSFLLALNSRRWQRMGVEYIREVTEIVQSYVPSLEVHPGDIHSAELDDDSLDVVTYWHVFEHLHDPRQNLKRTLELLRPGGHLFISVPRFDNWQPRTFKNFWHCFDVPRHLHHFSQRSLEILLEEVGFSALESPFFPTREHFHQIKHSVLRWSRERISSRVPYYLLKPFLLGIPLLERLTHSSGILTMVARKPLLQK
jgi:SAM-dependent methyltransferase